MEVADILAHHNLPFTAIDADTENAQLYRHYHKTLGVQRIDLTERETMVDFLRDLSAVKSGDSPVLLSQKPEPLILIDLPSGAEGKFRTFEEEFDFLSVLDQLGWDITFVNLLSPIKDCVNALRLLLKLAEGA